MNRYEAISTDDQPSTRTATTGSVADVSPRLVSRIDDALRTLTGRSMIGAVEMEDLLLDLRLQVVLDATLPELSDSITR